ncbi:MAG: hypothetical protein WC564_00170 [Patescibacteria group bacterium]
MENTEIIEKLIDGINKNEIPISEVGLILEKYELNKIQSEEFTLTIDYRRTLEEMIAAGKFDHFRPKFDSGRYSLPPELKGKIVTVKAKLFRFKEYTTNKEGVIKIMNAGYKPGTLAELLALAEAYPGLQKRFMIPAWGSQNQMSDQPFCCPFINMRENGRWLDSLVFNEDRADYYHLLATKTI